MSFTPTITTLLAALRHRGYAYESAASVFTLNLVGVRTHARRPSHFDDFVTAFYRTNGTWILNVFPATTDPGLFWLQHPVSPRGTAILREGQYRDAYGLGRHRNLYRALVQRRAVTVVRDANRDDHVDLTSGREETGLFGINIHRASARNRTLNVDRWSAGCQVVACPRQFAMLMDLCEEHRSIHGNRFTYTLLNERDFEEATRGSRVPSRAPEVPSISGARSPRIPAAMAGATGG